MKPLKAYAARVLDWLRAGYPQGVPEQDYQPLLAVLGRRLSEDELIEVCDALLAEGMIPADKIDIGVEVTKVLGEMPSERDMNRVADRLRRAGWPVDWPAARPSDDDHS